MICSYKECKKEFNPKTHNQKYCSDECCRTATNEKLKEAYYEKKARLQGKKRVCKSTGCTTILSRYNEGKVCGKCLATIEKNKQREIIAMVRDVSGKTSKD
jgi:ribosomal protein S27AE